MADKKQADFILASASPRRKDILKQAGYNFDIIVSDIDESAFSSENITPSEFAAQLAFAKAVDIAKKNPEILVLGADTIVDLKGQIIGKPSDAEHAREITTQLFSQPHKVITAIALIRLSDNTKIIETDTTIVYPKKMTPDQIDRHIQGNSWQGKAGAYAIQETGDQFVEKLQGSITNVMGLPIELINNLLPDLLKK